jgi:hypothetical protein
MLVSLAVFGAAPIPADNAARKAYIRNLPIADQQDLLRNLQRFSALSPAEQQQLRALHAAIEAHPRAAQLRETLERYHEWLKNLRPEERAELLELEPTARLARVEQLLKHQREEHDRRRPGMGQFEGYLSSKDQRIVAAWLNELVWSQRDQLLAQLPEDRRRQLAARSEPQQRRELVFFAFQQWRSGKSPLPADEVTRLVSQLSPAARQKYREAAVPDARDRLVRQWIVQSSFSRFNPGGMRRGWANVSAEELDRFMTQDLPPEERQRLLDLPREQLNEELRHLYLRRMQHDPGPRRGRPHRPPFGPPGFGPPHADSDFDRDDPPRDRPRGDRSRPPEAPRNASPGR